jgi:hypothetical protein
MNYLLEIISFEQWLETNYLPNDAQLLWYRLMYLDNKAGGCEWVSVDNLRLMGMIGVRREATFILLRDKLLEAGLIEYVKGKKRQPGQYRMISVSGKLTFKNVNQNEVQSVVQSVVKTKLKRSESVVQTEVKTVPEINKYEGEGANLTHNIEHDNSQTPPLFKDLNNIDLKDQDHKRESRAFVPPSLKQVADYCAERKNGIDPQRFIDFYTAKNWFIGKNKMKDWRAAVRTWENRNKEGGMSGGANQTTLKFPPASESGKSPYDAMFDR